MLHLYLPTIWFVTSSKHQTIVNCESWSPAWFVILDTRISTLQTPSFRSFNWRECRAVKKPRFNPCDLIDRRILVATEWLQLWQGGQKKWENPGHHHILCGCIRPVKQIQRNKFEYFLFVGICLGYTNNSWTKHHPNFGDTKTLWTNHYLNWLAHLLG